MKIDDDGNIEYKADLENLKKQYEQVDWPTIHESDVAKVEVFKCDAKKISSESSKFGVGNFSIPSQPSQIADLIKNGVDTDNVGKILTDYKAPTTFNYTIKDANGKQVNATITYPSSNTINDLATSSTESSAPSSSSSSPSSSSATQSSTSSESKSKAGAASSFQANSGLRAVLAGVASALL